MSASRQREELLTTNDGLENTGAPAGPGNFNFGEMRGTLV